MPKTKNAFFLEGITDGYILQRPYFKDFNFDNVSDAEIILKLIASSDATVFEMEDKMDIIRKLYFRVLDYNKLIDRYARRLKKIRRRPFGDITTAIFGLVGLPAQLEKIYKETDKMAQETYQLNLRTRVKEYRLKAGLTQKNVCDYLGVLAQTYYKYETGIANIPLHVIIRLARLFGVTTDNLLLGR